MKSLTINTLLVAAALALSVTPSMAASVETANPGEESDRHRVTGAASSAPFHALSRLDAQSLEEQKMTNEELQAIEGSEMFIYRIDLGWSRIWFGEYSDKTTFVEVYF
jgi:hypothetical protein